MTDRKLMQHALEGKAVWVIIPNTAKDGTRSTHVVPDEDLYEHVLSYDCWCQPSLELEHMIATHNSADKREEFESGQRKPS